MKNKLLLNPFLFKLRKMLARFSTKSVYVGNGRVLVNTLAGPRLYVYGNDVSVAPHLICQGYYEKEVTRAIVRLTKPGMHVLEIGANIGYHTTLFGGGVGGSGSVLVFEAFPKTYEMLMDNIHINGLATIVRAENLAVYNKDGEVSFSFLEKQHGSSGIINKNSIEDLYKETATVYTLPCTKIDSYLKNNSIVTKFDIVKIDAEGAEPFILDGMQSILGQDHLILIIEIAQELLRKVGQLPEAFLNKIKAYNFNAYEINNSGKLEQTTFEKILDNESYRDVVFIK